MSHSKSQKNESKTSRASIPVAETRYDPSYNEIAERAYQCWNERGCPNGSPEVDWSRAEEELRGKRQAKAAAANSLLPP